jgi:hypothetical protein
MAITNFIPTIWSENLASSLDKQYIAVAHCNRDYEGEIKNRGSVVKICGVGSIDAIDYTKDTDMSSPQALSDTVQELCIDQAKYFNFQIDDIDKTQCTPKLMDAAMKVAASSIANIADKFVYELVDEAAATVSCDASSEGDLLGKIIDARQKLYENNVSDMENVVLEVSPAVASVILKEKIALPFCDASVAETGYLGSFAGCKIYVSNNIKKETSDAGTTYDCLMRTTRAIAYAEQFSEIDAYRPEKRFADAVKGLHLYGAKVVYPSEMVCLKVSFNTAN